MPQDNVTRAVEDLEYEMPQGVPLHPAGRGFSYMGAMEDTISPISPLRYDSFNQTLSDQDDQHHPVRELTPG